MSMIPISEEAWNLAMRTLEALSVPSAYEGERTGGVLRGCPREPAPTPEELAVKVKLVVDRINRLNDGHPWRTALEKTIKKQENVIRGLTVCSTCSTYLAPPKCPSCSDQINFNHK